MRLGNWGEGGAAYSKRAKQKIEPVLYYDEGTKCSAVRKCFRELCVAPLAHPPHTTYANTWRNTPVRLGQHLRESASC